MLYFPLSREEMMVEPGTAISVSVQFDRLFLPSFRTICFLQELNLGLHVERVC